MKRSKTYFVLFITLAALLLTTGLVFAESGELKAVAAKLNFYIGGKDVQLSEQAVEINGRTYLPVRVMGEALGKRIGWDADSKTVVIDELLKDGIYKASGNDFDEHGWKATVELEVKNGIIASVKYDEIDKDGLLKSTSEKYLKQFTEITKGDMLENYNILQESLIAAQNVDMVDVVSGATYSTNNFKTLVNEALGAGPVE